MYVYINNYKLRAAGAKKFSAKITIPQAVPQVQKNEARITIILGLKRACLFMPRSRHEKYLPTSRWYSAATYPSAGEKQIKKN